MNMNHEPLRAQETTERRPLPRWVNWLAAVLIFAGYGLLEYQDHITEQAIQQSTQGATKR